MPISTDLRFCVLIVCALLLTACALQSHRSFRVLPGTPDYLLQDPASRRTPLPELLRAFNGFERGGPFLDLRPNMELRIENAYYRPGFSRRGLNGYLGTEVAQYKLRRQGGLGLMSVRPLAERPNEQLPADQLISASAQHHRNYRFYYEVWFRKSGSTRGSVLLGAETQDEVERLTSELALDPDATCGPGSAGCTVFPEACSVSIEMEIVVDGSRRNVLWGSLLSDLAESGHMDLALFRIYDGRLRPVKFNAKNGKALQLPLLPGDQVKRILR